VNVLPERPTARYAGTVPQGFAAITELAHALNIETTAEGVEETAQLMELRAHGCSSVQGFLFAFIGLMPSLSLACLFLFLGRILLGAEFAVQETLLMRAVPDKLRGRVSTTDRATELLTWSVSTSIAGWSLRAITPRTLTIFSGLLSAVSGAVWLVLFASGRISAPSKWRSSDLIEKS